MFNRIKGWAARGKQWLGINEENQRTSIAFGIGAVVGFLIGFVVAW